MSEKTEQTSTPPAAAGNPAVKKSAANVKPAERAADSTANLSLSVSDWGGRAQRQVSVSESLFARKFNAPLLHQTLVATMANGRLGTRKQKNRAEVTGTRKKMFRQKGSGRARAGHRSSPLRRSGGRAFPSSPDENFSKKINRRAFAAAMGVIFSQLHREARIVVVDGLAAKTNKTRDFLPLLSALKVSGKVLLVDVEVNHNLALASRNVPNVDVLPLSFVLPTDLVDADFIVFSEPAIARSNALWG